MFTQNHKSMKIHLSSEQPRDFCLKRIQACDKDPTELLTSKKTNKQTNAVRLFIIHTLFI